MAITPISFSVTPNPSNTGDVVEISGEAIDSGAVVYGAGATSFDDGNWVKNFGKVADPVFSASSIYLPASSTTWTSAILNTADVEDGDTVYIETVWVGGNRYINTMLGYATGTYNAPILVENYNGNLFINVFGNSKDKAFDALPGDVFKSELTIEGATTSVSVEVWREGELYLTHSHSANTGDLTNLKIQVFSIEGSKSVTRVSKNKKINYSTELNTTEISTDNHNSVEIGDTAQFGDTVEMFASDDDWVTRTSLGSEVLEEGGGPFDGSGVNKLDMTFGLSM